MGFEDEVEQSNGRPCRHERQIQADMRTPLIHRPARDIIPPLGGFPSYLLSRLIRPAPCPAAAFSCRFKRYSPPSPPLRCMITTYRPDRAPIAFFFPQRTHVCIA